jgi:hypothetical protein
MRPLSLLALLGLSLVTTTATRADAPKSAPLTAAPANLDELRALEKRVQEVVARVQPAVVGVELGGGSGSGVLVKDGFVLTAGHVSGKPGRTVTLRMPDGKKLKGKTLGHNQGIDSGLIKVEGADKLPAIEMGKASELKKGQWVVSIGHPGGFRDNRTPVVRLGRVQEVKADVILTDCTLVGGDSGGPLFDLDGKVIGIHSRIGLLITQNYHVPVDTYVTTWDRLVKGEDWGGGGGLHLVYSPGGKAVFEKKEKLTGADPLDKVREKSHRKVYSFKMGPGSLYTIDLAGKGLESSVRVEDSTGKALAADDGGAGESDARIVFRPTKEETYQVIVTTAKAGQTGAFTLTIRQIALGEVLASGPVQVYQALKIPRFAVPSVIKQFAAARGPLVVSATVFGADGKPAADKEVVFQWDRDKNALKTDAQGQVRLPLFRKMGDNLVLTLPPEHKALVELTDKGGKLHLYRFTTAPDVGKLPPPPAGKVVLLSEGKLTTSDAMDKVRTECRHKVIPFKAKAGMRYAFDLESMDFDSYLRVENSAGKQLAEDDDSAGDFNARLFLRTEKDDTLRIVVTTCDPGQSGAYRLTVRETEKK